MVMGTCVQEMELELITITTSVHFLMIKVDKKKKPIVASAS